MAANEARQTKAQRDAARRAKAEQLRRAEQAKTRRRRLIGWGSVVLGVLVVAAIVVVILVQPKAPASAKTDTASQIVPAAVGGTTPVTQQAPKKVADTSGIDGVLAWDTTGWPGDGSAHAGALEHDHVTGPVSYAVTPPVGGPHDAVWMNAGVYTKPVPNERAVHNLEHGAVWITYRPSLPKVDVAALTKFVGSQSLIPESEQGVTRQANRYVDLSPWTDNSLPAPIVISAWGHQLRLSDPSDPRLQKFVDTFRHSQKYTPEYGAAVDGVPVQTGGVPAAFGSVKPNPSGSAQG